MKRRFDALVAEIGSTTTLVNAFEHLDTAPHFAGQGVSATTVLQGDVRTGLQAAVTDLSEKLGADIEWDTFLATSSAAGGLRMSVHGLVYDMTVRAAREAALGAGAVVRLVTAGKMNAEDIRRLEALHPNLILLSGGTDYGETETALHNARLIASGNLADVPVLYAGNVRCQQQVADIFPRAGISCTLTDNVYPRLDCLNILPARRQIQRLFEAHIVQAPGMAHVRDVVDGPIMPTPGAVMEAAQLLYEQEGPLAVVDIGGATTDVHSVCEPTEEIGAILSAPEPFAKRTVEGDLGLYVNAHHLIEQLGEEALGRELGLDIAALMHDYPPIPQEEAHLRLAQRLCREAGQTALKRHAGTLRYLYTPSGRVTVAEGKDLGAIRLLVGTGGALTRLPRRAAILRQLADMNANGLMLYPKPGQMRTAQDGHYIMASLGVLSLRYRQAALQLLHNSLYAAEENA